MRIKILKFEVVESYVLRDTWWNKIRKFFSHNYEVDQYHFDIQMLVDPEYEAHSRRLEKFDFIELPNKVRLSIWSVDRFGMVKAKTYNLVKENLRHYHPMEMYLVYPHTHGRISDVS
jgi:hypothetical protein